jgi:hypothetical protein
LEHARSRRSVPIMETHRDAVGWAVITSPAICSHRIYGWFTEGFDTRDLKEAKALLDTLAA